MKKYTRFFALLLVIVSILSTSVSAAEYSNAYIRSGGAYIHRWAAGDISVDFHVFGTGIMDTIGVYRLTVYRMKGETPDSGSDELIVTYWHDDYPDMMITNDVVYHNSIRLKVEAGQNYYAVLVFYASLDGGGDIMPFSTDPVMA